MILALSFWYKKLSGFTLVQLPCDEIQWELLLESLRFIIFIIILVFLAPQQPRGLGSKGAPHIQGAHTWEEEPAQVGS